MTDNTQTPVATVTFPNGTKLNATFENVDDARRLITKAMHDAYYRGRSDGTIDPNAAVTFTLYGGAKRVVNFASIADRDLILTMLGAKGSGTAQQVEIVAMPDRETTSEISRDSSNNIKTAKQVERDA